MSKKAFVIRLILFIVVGLLLPLGFLAWRFELFNEVTKVSFSVWGLVAIITVIVFSLKLFDGLRKGLKPGLIKQIIDTVCNVTIPIIIFVVVFDWMSDFAKEFVEFLIFLVICETAAGIIDPLPIWSFENNLEFTGSIFEKIFSSKEKK